MATRNYALDLFENFTLLLREGSGPLAAKVLLRFHYKRVFFWRSVYHGHFELKLGAKLTTLAEFTT